MSRSHRIVAYDALRVFAIVSVVAIHTLMPYRTVLPANAPVRVFDDWLHYAVPLFVFISGVFIWGRDYTGANHSLKAFFTRRMSVVLVPYLAWSALYLVILGVQRHGDLTLRQAFVLVVTGNAWYHLYFIPMLLTLYLLTPLATRVRAYSPELLLVTCYLFRIMLAPELLAATRSVLGVQAADFATHVFTHLPHMALGAWFAARQSRLPRNPVFSAGLLAFGSAVMIAASLGWTHQLTGYPLRLVYPVGMSATVLGMALLALRFEPGLERFTHDIVLASTLAFGVYFVHPLLLLAVNAAVGAWASSAVWMRPGFAVAVFAAVTCASFAFSYAMARLPVACRLAGVGRPITRQGQRTR